MPEIEELVKEEDSVSISPASENTGHLLEAPQVATECKGCKMRENGSQCILCELKGQGINRRKK